jgi:hypothetical protein
MALTWRSPWWSWSALACLFAGAACRSIVVCENEACEERAMMSSGGSSQGGVPDSTPEPTAEGGAAGEGGASNAGEAGAAGAIAEPPEPLACEDGLADCDGSTLTGCETNLGWSERHCGECGQVCEGLCQGRDCKPATLLADGSALAFVASSSTAFGVISSLEGESLEQFDVLSGKQSELIRSVDYEAQLAVSADRIYVWEPSSGAFQSALLSGADLRTEPTPVAIESFGASNDGVYYVDAPSSSESVSRLWFRGTGKAAWKKIFESSYLKLVASSEYGVLVAGDDGIALDSALMEVHGEVVKSLVMPSPDLDWDAAALTAAGPVLVASDELIWLTDPLTRYQIPSYSLSSRPPAVLDTEIILLSDENGTAFIQHYGRAGATTVRGGLASGSDLLLVDSTYVWYAVWDSAATRHLWRAEWYSLTP